MSDDEPRKVIRNPGPLAKGAAPRDQVEREGIARAVDDRTEEDVSLALPLPQQQRAEPARGPAADTNPNDPYGYYDDGPVRRLSGGDQAINLLDVPRHLLKPGWDGQYVTVSIYNQQIEGASIRQVMDAGWRPAKARDFRSLVMPNVPDDGPVINYGQQLYIRPLHMSEESKREEYKKALDAQRQRSQQSAQGQFAKAGERSDEGTLGSLDPKLIRTVPGGARIEGEMGTWGGRGDR